MRNRAVALLLLVLALAGCGRAGGTYVFIVVDEASSHVLEAAPVNDYRVPSFSANVETRALAVGHRALAPGRRTQAIVGYHARGRGVTLAHRVFALNRFPWLLSLTDPLRLEGEVHDLHGTSLGVLNVVDNTQRLVSFDLRLLAVDAAGAIRFLAGEEEVTLRPGESWLVAFVREDQAVRRVEWGEDWEAVIRAAIDRDDPVTRLEVFNHGLWEKRQVRVGMP